MTMAKFAITKYIQLQIFVFPTLSCLETYGYLQALEHKSMWGNKEQKKLEFRDYVDFSMQTENRN